MPIYFGEANNNGGCGFHFAMTLRHNESTGSQCAQYLVSINKVVVVKGVMKTVVTIVIKIELY